MLIDYKSNLNEEQYKAVVTTEGPLLILAGAGTGKTRTLVHRLAYLIESGVPAGSILMLTFTNKAAREMKERADTMLDGKCNGVIACTYHSFCVRELRIWGREIGLDPNFTIINPSDEIEIAEMMKIEQMKEECRYILFLINSQILELLIRLNKRRLPHEAGISGLIYFSRISHSYRTVILMVFGKNLLAAVISVCSWDVMKQLHQNSFQKILKRKR